MALPVSPQSRFACSVQIHLLNAEDGIPGVVLIVDAGAAPFRLPIFGHRQGVPED